MRFYSIASVLSAVSSTLAQQNQTFETPAETFQTILRVDNGTGMLVKAELEREEAESNSQERMDQR